MCKKHIYLSINEVNITYYLSQNKTFKNNLCRQNNEVKIFDNLIN